MSGASEQAGRETTASETIQATEVEKLPPESSAMRSSASEIADETVKDTKASDALNRKTQQLLLQLQKQLLAKHGPDEQNFKVLRKTWENLESEPIDDARRKQIENLFERIRKQLHQIIEKREQAVGTIHSHLASLEKSLEEGILIDSIKYDNKIQRGLRTIQGLSRQRRQAIEEKMDELQPKLRDLKAWRHWGTSIAREDLIKHVENLIGGKQPPSYVANEIQKARHTWRDWDKTGDSPGKDLWKRFDDVCTRAYEPCKAFFAKQAEQRQAHKEAREALCQKLEDCYENTDWRQPDWRGLDKLIHRTKIEWGRSGHVDRKLRKPLDERFDHILEKFEDYMDRERKRDHKRRQALIDRVKALADDLIPASGDESISEEKINTAIDAVKAAQKEWQPTITGKRGEENRLWKTFKAACDSIFEYRQKQHQQANAGRNENAKRKEGLIKELEKLQKANANELEQINCRLAQVQGEWNGIGEAPYKREASLEKRFRQALRQLRSHRSHLGKKASQAAIMVLAEKAAICEKLETAILEDSIADLDVSQMENTWNAIAKPDEDIENTMEKRFQLALGAIRGENNAKVEIEGSLEENKNEKQSLCLQLEILCEIDSPVEFSKDRMALQIQRLSAAMSHQTPDASHGPLSNVNDGLKRFYLAGPVDPVTHKSLNARLQRILQAKS